MATAGLDHGMLWTDLEGRELNGRWKLDAAGAAGGTDGVV